MKVSLRNGKTAFIRQLSEHDTESLYNYLQLLSPESRSRFGPHSFDRQTITSIREQPGNGIKPFIAVDDTSLLIVAYMLVKRRLIEEDRQRYAQRDQFFEPGIMVTFAPPVADTWQNFGLGTAKSNVIEGELKTEGSGK